MVEGLHYDCAKCIQGENLFNVTECLNMQMQYGMHVRNVLMLTLETISTL